MVTLQNEFLTVQISPFGAELKSIQKNGVEYIYPSREEVWSGSAPILFPITGGLKEDTYTHGGKTYYLQKHGFARESLFELAESTETHARFRLTDSEQTRASYPFSFIFDAVYDLSGDTLSVSYQVKNKSDETMYFSVGAHEGYYTPEGIEEYDMIFDSPVTLDHTALWGNLLSTTKRRVMTNSTTLPIYEKFFVVDALVFEGITEKSLTFRNRKSGRGVRICYPFAPNLLVWHMPNAPYLCIEPWAGIPDRVGTSFELKEKEDIISLSVGEEYCATHTITILEENYNL